VHRLLWLPSGVVAAVAHVEGRGGKEAGPQLLLYPQYHLDNASLLARVPLKQVCCCCKRVRDAVLDCAWPTGGLLRPPKSGWRLETDDGPWQLTTAGGREKDCAHNLLFS
jgi:hypothetical protein